jgi:hypothetical protein
MLTVLLSNEHQLSQLDSPSTANEDQRRPLGLPNAADEGQPLPAALLGTSNGRQKSPPATRSADSGKQGVERRWSWKNRRAAADAPPSKRQKVNRQVGGAGSDVRRSNRDRRPTSKAAEEG